MTPVPAPRDLFRSDFTPGDRLLVAGAAAIRDVALAFDGCRDLALSDVSAETLATLGRRRVDRTIVSPDASDAARRAVLAIVGGTTA